MAKHTVNDASKRWTRDMSSNNYAGFIALIKRVVAVHNGPVAQKVLTEEVLASLGLARSKANRTVITNAVTSGLTQFTTAKNRFKGYDDIVVVGSRMEKRITTKDFVRLDPAEYPDTDASVFPDPDTIEGVSAEVKDRLPTRDHLYNSIKRLLEQEPKNPTSQAWEQKDLRAIVELLVPDHAEIKRLTDNLYVFAVVERELRNMVDSGVLCYSPMEKTYWVSAKALGHSFSTSVDLTAMTPVAIHDMEVQAEKVADRHGDRRAPARNAGLKMPRSTYFLAPEASEERIQQVTGRRRPNPVRDMGETEDSSDVASRRHKLLLQSANSGIELHKVVDRTIRHLELVRQSLEVWAEDRVQGVEDNLLAYANVTDHYQAMLDSTVTFLHVTDYRRLEVISTLAIIEELLASFK